MTSAMPKGARLKTGNVKGKQSSKPTLAIRNSDSKALALSLDQDISQADAPAFA